MIDGGTWLDIVLVLALLGYAVGRYRIGLLRGALSLAGLLGGGILALWLLPGLLERWSATRGEVGIFLIIGVFLVAAVGQSLGDRVGRGLRSLLRIRPVLKLDSVLGSAASIVVGATLLWLVAGAVEGTLPAPASRVVAQSRVLQGIDRAMPSAADNLVAGARRALDRQGFPRVFTGVYAEPIRPVAPPGPGVARGRGVAAAADSIVKVTGLAPGCRRTQEGSGWVAAPHRVVTNAHVVAGVEHPRVQVGGTGRSYPATPVAFAPKRDVAVLAVPGLSARPLPAGHRLSHDDAAVVAGFPRNGPYEVDAVRVRAVLQARGTDIYGSPGATRQVYSINGRVQPGNSGGPLLSPSGRVVGTVFAKSVSDPRTGYALTLAETQPVVAKAAGATRAVSTGSCTSD